MKNLIYICPKCEREYKTNVLVCQCGEKLLSVDESIAEDVIKKYRERGIQSVEDHLASKKNSSTSYPTSKSSRAEEKTKEIKQEDPIALANAKARRGKWIEGVSTILLAGVAFLSVEVYKADGRLEDTTLAKIFPFSVEILRDMGLGKTPFEKTLEIVYAENPSDISPVLLNRVYTFRSQFTDLQRNEVEAKITGKIVVWNLKVYEVKKLDKWTAKIQTTSGIVDNRTDMQKMYQELLDFGALVATGDSVFEKAYAYQAVSTMITLKVRDESEWQLLSTLKTGDFLRIRGRIAGLSALRSIEIDPAVLDSRENSNLYKSQLEKTNSSTQNISSQSTQSPCSSRRDYEFGVANGLRMAPPCPGQ